MPTVIEIGDYSFKTKKLAMNFVRAIRDRYSDGALINESDGAFLRELLSLHPEADMKIGVGIASFTVATETVFNKTRHFVVRRGDNTSTDFSFKSCIDGSNDRKDRLQALRRAVKQQIIAFKNSAFAGCSPPVCPFTGANLTQQEAHVDHEHPDTFLELVRRWLFETGIALADLAITPTADNQIVAELTDNRQQTSWIDFHSRNAKLRIISSAANLSHARRTDVLPTS